MNTARQLSRFYLRAAAVTAAITFGTSAFASHLIYNWTESLPRGWYWVARGHAPARGELVAFRIPPNVERLVHDRRYLPDGALLVKPVIALPGDHVCTEGGVFTVNGEVIGAVQTEDSAGRPLPHPEVCETVPLGEVYVASHHPRSFDSRTFGPVPVAEVRGEVTPLWIR